MGTRQVPVHVASTRRTYGGKTYCTHLLRRTYREDGKVKNEKLGNLSHLPKPVTELIRRGLRGETLVNPADGFEIVASRARGDAAAVLATILRLRRRALFGARRSREADLLIGLLTDRRGCPLAVSVYPGNVGDAKTLLPQVEKLNTDFGLEEAVLVGDRGMIGQPQIDTLRETAGPSGITALKSGQIRSLVSQDALQLGLFDERNLLELTHPDYPGERLVAVAIRRSPNCAPTSAPRCSRPHPLVHARLLR